MTPSASPSSPAGAPRRPAALLNPIYWHGRPVLFLRDIPALETPAVPLGPPAPDADHDGNLIDKFQLFAALNPAQAHYVAPGLFGRTPEPTFATDEDEIKDWAAVCHHKRQHASREEFYAFLETCLVVWLSHERERPLIELRGKLALSMIVEQGLWKEFVDADGRQRFRSDNDFIKTFLTIWGLGDTAARVSHLKRAARLWFSIEGKGLPTPPSLWRLERFGDHGKALVIYERLVKAAGGALPTDSAIEAELYRIDHFVSKESQNSEKPPKTGRRAQAAERERVWPKIFSRLEKISTLSELDEYKKWMRAKQEAIEKLHPERQPTPKPQPKPTLHSIGENYDHTLGCPLLLIEYTDSLEIHLQAMPEHGLAAAWKESRRKGWTSRHGEPGDGPNGGLVITIDLLGANPTRVLAIRREAREWINAFCTKLKVPPLARHPQPGQPS